MRAFRHRIYFTFYFPVRPSCRGATRLVFTTDGAMYTLQLEKMRPLTIPYLNAYIRYSDSVE